MRHVEILWYCNCPPPYCSRLFWVEALLTWIQIHFLFDGLLAFKREITRLAFSTHICILLVLLTYQCDPLTQGREESPPKKLGQAATKNWKVVFPSALWWFMTYPLSLRCTVFLYYSVWVELRHNFETHHLEFKKRVTEYFIGSHDGLFQSQILLQLFKWEIKKLVKRSSGLNFYGKCR